jgi:hypothetical protein
MQIDLPSFGVIVVGTEVFVVASVFAHMNWILLEICNIMCSMSALDDSICCLGFLLTFLEEMLAKADC